MQIHGDSTLMTDLGPIPDDRQLVELIAAIAPGDTELERLLVGNPERLYQFGVQA
jgi:2-pyrone-4,6-dicarboxylate lactonase